LERPRAGPDVVLDDDVGRRAELARELNDVAAADLEMAVLGQAAAERIDVAERAGHAARHDPRSCTLSWGRQTGWPTRCSRPTAPAVSSSCTAPAPARRTTSTSPPRS